MAFKRVLTSDQQAGKATYFVDDVGGRSIVTEQNVDHIVEANKRAANDFRAGSLIGDTQAHHRKIAEIPVSVYYDLVKRLGPPNQNQKAWLRWLSDPDNRFFRTTTESL